MADCKLADVNSGNELVDVPSENALLSSVGMASDLETVDLTIKTFSGQTVANLRVPASAAVKTIKAALSASTGNGALPISRQRLLLGTSVLTDEQQLADLGAPTELLLVRLQWKSEDATFERGDLVQLHCDGNVIFESLEGTEQPWVDGMNEMLGRSFQVRSVPKEGFVGLPNPDPSHSREDVVFPESVVRAGEELQLGDIVRMLPTEEAVRLSFATANYVWDHLMTGMLGKEFPILQMTRKGIIALPSPDGSQGGKWYFPVSCVTKVASDFEAVVLRQSDAVGVESH